MNNKKMLFTPLIIAGVLFAALSFNAKSVQANNVSEEANLFNGTGWEWCMTHGYGSEYLCEFFYGDFANDKVIMKWSDEWAIGEAEDWINPPYKNAWVIEHWNGNVKDGSEYSQYWKYRWDEGCATTHVPSVEGGYCWGGYPFIILMERWKVLGYSMPSWFAHAVPAGVGK